MGGHICPKMVGPPTVMHGKVYMLTTKSSDGECLGTDFFAFYLLSFMLLDMFAVE